MCVCVCVCERERERDKEREREKETACVAVCSVLQCAAAHNCSVYHSVYAVVVLIGYGTCMKDV